MRRVLIALMPLLSMVVACQTQTTARSACPPEAEKIVTATDGRYLMACRNGAWERVMTVEDLAATVDGDASAGSTAALPADARLSAGESHTCAVRRSGVVECWGSNVVGQLGRGFSSASEAPSAVRGVTNAVAVSAGANHTCALLADGSISCWGANFHGELGSGSNSDISATPVEVAGISDAVSLDAGSTHACAVLADDTAQCWGSNSSGELGDGTRQASNEPQAVSGLTSVAALTAGGSHSCAVLRNSSVMCWGDNTAGQLGSPAEGDVASGATEPAAVSGVALVGALSAGTTNVCALLVDRTVWCWGGNDSGQSGLPTPGEVYRSPARIPYVDSATGISTGAGTTCASLVDGTVECWGRNADGQLANGTTYTGFVPRPMAGVSGAASVSVGDRHSCALLDSDAVVCAGANMAGQLGSSAPSDHSTSAQAIASSS